MSFVPFMTEALDLEDLRLFLELATDLTSASSEGSSTCSASTDSSFCGGSFRICA